MEALQAIDREKRYNEYINDVAIKSIQKTVIRVLLLATPCVKVFNGVVETDIDERSKVQIEQINKMLKQYIASNYSDIFEPTQ